MERKNRWVFIVNPVAGNGFAGSYAQRVTNMAGRHGVEAEIVFTKAPGHATEIADDYARRGYPVVCGVGGDGTFGEIVQGLMDKKNVTFGAVAAGTGNDFIAITGFSSRFADDEWESFFRGDTVMMDVGKCNSRYFINGMGLGFDAQVAAENYDDNGQKVKGGFKYKYWWHILKNLVAYRENGMRLTRNGHAEEMKNFLNTIAIGRRFAGGFYLTPEAIANDGLFDVCMVHELNFPGRVRELLAVLRKAHIGHEAVEYFKTERILFEFDRKVPAHLDGELYFASRFEISILPSRLRIIYNTAGNHFFRS